MPWFKIDDTLHGHPKVRRAGLEAMGLWSLAGSYAMSYATDGFVPEWFVTGLPRGARLAARLVAAGLWHPAGDDAREPGWVFHDWTHYQPTRAEIEADREAARLRQQRARQARRDARVTGGPAEPEVTPDVTRDTRRTSGVSHSPPTRPDPTRPVLEVLPAVRGGRPSPRRHSGDGSRPATFGLGED